MLSSLPQDKYIKIGDINTRFWQAGDTGSAIILVHGLGGFIENWIYNIGPLAVSHRVYAIDLLGFGRSDKKPLINDLMVLVKFIKDFLDTQNIAKASLIGNSLGGGLVLAFALDYPANVEKLVLVDTAGMGRGVITDFKVCSLPIFGELLIRPNPEKSARLWAKIVYDASVLTPEMKELTNEYASAVGAPQAMLAALRAGINLFGQKDKLTRPVLARLGTIKAPVLVVWGDRDRIIPPAHARVAAEKIFGARLEIFDRCGHMPMFEYPEKFNKLVLDFLAK